MPAASYALQVPALRILISRKIYGYSPFFIQTIYSDAHNLPLQAHLWG